MITINQRNEVERERCKAEYDDKRKGKISVPFFQITNQEI
jgi:hypothetical protein